MKIGITCYPGAGGSGVVATELGYALARKGHHAHFISYSRPFRLERDCPRVHFHKVKTVTYPLFKYPPYSLALAVRMAEVTRNVNLDVLHVHYAIPHATSAYLANRILEPESVKVVTTLHGTDITLVGADESFYEITRLSIKHSNAVTAVSRFLERETRRKLHIDKTIDVIPNFIDPDKFTRRKEGSIIEGYNRNDGPLIVHISNFRRVKNVLDVVRLTARVNEYLVVHCLLVGEGPEKEACRILAEELGVDDRIHFMGNRTEVEKILPHADLFLLPSTVESFGLVALEAMACGVPVVGYNGGGLPEVVRHGEDGFLAPLGNLERMIEMTLDLLQNSDLRRRIGERARNRAIEEFSTERVTKMYEELYLRVLENE